MIQHLRVANFKSIGEPALEMDLCPLTLLVGPNGSGKSTLLEAIALACAPHLSTEVAGLTLGEHLFFTRDLNRSLEIAVWLDREFAPVPIPDLRFRGSAAETRPAEDLVGSYWSTGEARFASGFLRSERPDNDSVILENAQNNVFLISAIRGMVGAERRADNPTPRWAGRRGQDLVPLLAVIVSPEHASIRSQLARAMKSFGMDDPWAGWKGEGVLAAKYADPALKTSLEAASASAGARQALTVVAQLAWSSPGSLTMIEEPELSLHPEAQIAMCRFLAEQVAKGKQVIATTHSQFLLLGLRQLIREGIISSDAVAVYHVKRIRDARTGEKGATTVVRLPLAREGYLEAWVPSFSKVERDLARDWASTDGEKWRRKVLTD